MSAWESVMRKMRKDFLHDLIPTDILDQFEEEQFVPVVPTLRDIKEQTTTSDKIRMILKVVNQRGENGYKVFKQCLIKSKHDHLVERMNELEQSLGYTSTKQEMTDAQGTTVEVLQQSVGTQESDLTCDQGAGGDVADSVALRTKERIRRRSLNSPPHQPPSPYSRELYFKLVGFSIRGFHRETNSQTWVPRKGQICQLHYKGTGHPVDVNVKKERVGSVHADCSKWVKKCMHDFNFEYVRAVVKHATPVERTKHKGKEVLCDFIFRCTKANNTIHEYVRGIRPEIDALNEAGEGPYAFEELPPKARSRKSNVENTSPAQDATTGATGDSSDL